MTPLTAMLRIALLALLASACISTPRSEADADASASPPVDATPRSDADPSCTAWHSLEATLVSVTLLDSEPLRVGRSARVRLGLMQCPGDSPGLWGFTPSLDAEVGSLWSLLWRAGNDCSEPELVTRDLTLRFPRAGSWTLSAGKLSLFAEVLGEAQGACESAPPAACQRDCDCPYAEVCLSGTGAGSQARCAQPCQFDRDCQGRGICGNQDGLEGICLRNVPECATPGRACSDGFSCVAGTCEPAFRLDQGTRHECSCDTECDTGMRCVESPGPGQSSRHCQALCFTPSDAWCQGPHTCNARASVEDGLGVCEWVGE